MDARLPPATGEGSNRDDDADGTAATVVDGARNCATDTRDDAGANDAFGNPSATQSYPANERDARARSPPRPP